MVCSGIIHAGATRCTITFCLVLYTTYYDVHVCIEASEFVYIMCAKLLDKLLAQILLNQSGYRRVVGINRFVTWQRLRFRVNRSSSEGNSLGNVQSSWFFRWRHHSCHEDKIGLVLFMYAHKWDFAGQTTLPAPLRVLSAFSNVLVASTRVNSSRPFV